MRARFDTDRFLGDGRAWAVLLLETRNAAPIGIAALGALLLVGWTRVVRELEALAEHTRSPREVLAWCLPHVAVFALFHQLTASTFGGDADHGPVLGLARVLLWGLLALAVPASAALAAYRGSALLASLRRLAPALALASLLGTAAFLLSRLVLDSGLWYPLAVSTTRLAGWLLAVAGVGSAPADETFILQVGDFRVLITRWCSGFEGIALIWTFLTAYLVWFRERLRFPRALVLLPVGTLLVWLVNALRLATLAWIGGTHSAEVAMQGFHSYAGWLTFCALSLGLVYASQRWAWLARAPRAPAASAGDLVNPTAVYLGPFLAVVAVSFVTGAVSAGVDAFYPLRVMAGGLVLWSVRHELPWPSLRPRVWGVVYGAVAFVAWIALERAGVQASAPEEPHPGAGLGALWVLSRFLGFLLLAPLVEEVAFRGFLARRLVRADFESVPYAALTPFAWALSSLAFGLLHAQWIAATLAGALYGLVAVRHGRLSDAIWAHATTNALLVLWYAAVGPWDAWM